MWVIKGNYNLEVNSDCVQNGVFFLKKDVNPDLILSDPELTDASDYGLRSACKLLHKGTVEKTIAFESRTFSNSENKVLLTKKRLPLFGLLLNE